MKRFVLIIVVLATVLACVWMGLLYRDGIGPQSQSAMTTPKVYAYRDWQRIGVQVSSGDTIYIRARGRWLYTPGEYHGPEGHKVYRAPDTYPIPSIAGGLLLGRIGDEGSPFVVGRGRTLVADREGALYLRINDDILSDNKGYVRVEVTVSTPTP
jgi:hypothetical protein